MISRYINIAILTFAVIFISFSLDSPVNWDQVDFYAAAEASMKTGIPVYNIAVNIGEEVGLWHPPLYIYLMALSFKVFGVNIIAARLVGIVSLIISLILIRGIIRRIYPNRHSDIFCLFLLLTGLSPYIIQGTLLLDIDNTILTTLILLFLYVYLTYRVNAPSVQTCRGLIHQTLSNHLLLALLFAILLWAKFTTPFVIPISIFIYHLINKRIKLALHGLFTIGGIGLIVFLLSFWAYCSHNNLPFDMAVSRNLGIAAGSLSNFSNKAYDIIKKLGNFSFWLSPFYIVLLVMNIIWWLRKILLPNPRHPVNLVYLIAYLSFFGYLIIRMDAYYYPRYIFPSVILINLLASEMVVNLLPATLALHASLNRQIWFFLIGITLISTIFYLIFLVDPLLEFNNLKRGLSHESMPDVVKRIAAMVFMYLVPTLICIISLKKTEIKRLFGFLLILMMVASYISLDIVQAQANYSTSYFYGEEGFRETVKFLKDNLKEGEFFAARSRDLAVMSGKRFYIFDRLHPEDVSGILKNNDIKYLVLRDEFYLDGITSRNVFDDIMANKENNKIISENYALVKRYGFFRIYEKKIYEG